MINFKFSKDKFFSNTYVGQEYDNRKITAIYRNECIIHLSDGSQVDLTKEYLEWNAKQRELECYSRGVEFHK